ncbi:hypothetical protein J6590_103516 [Homalodisca vitripennis]|nr:hypothetical protein J6590_062643 [Homalodisca vitripennis]KAG8313943.1 hypothetical protein J6590_103516 [Homalodisca vitripennis]
MLTPSLESRINDIRADRRVNLEIMVDNVQSTAGTVYNNICIKQKCRKRSTRTWEEVIVQRGRKKACSPLKQVQGDYVEKQKNTFSSVWTRWCFELAILHCLPFSEIPPLQTTDLGGFTHRQLTNRPILLALSLTVCLAAILFYGRRDYIVPQARVDFRWICRADVSACRGGNMQYSSASPVAGATGRRFCISLWAFMNLSLAPSVCTTPCGRALVKGPPPPHRSCDIYGRMFVLR